MPVIVVHGGAGDIKPHKREAVAQACAEAAAVGWRVLAGGGSALDAVVAAVRSLEDCPLLNAGRGACLDANGDVSLDAALMVGRDLSAGAVGNVPPLRHPIDLARAVLEHSPHVLLVGPGALEWGRQHGIEGCAADDLRVPADEPAEEKPHDTVGAVALDADGVIVAGTSTGGVRGKHPARVGDSPLLGCGTYADDEAGGASATGTGELIMRVTLARACVDAMRAGEHPTDAARRLTAELSRRVGGGAGIILVDRHGRVGLGHSTLGMSWAWQDAEGAACGWKAP
jgi:beta-aspartyl-peptidase (threonine type)